MSDMPNSEANAGPADSGATGSGAADSSATGASPTGAAATGAGATGMNSAAAGERRYPGSAAANSSATGSGSLPSYPVTTAYSGSLPDPNGQNYQNGAGYQGVPTGGYSGGSAQYPPYVAGPGSAAGPSSYQSGPTAGPTYQPGSTSYGTGSGYAGSYSGSGYMGTGYQTGQAPQYQPGSASQYQSAPAPPSGPTYPGAPAPYPPAPYPPAPAYQQPFYYPPLRGPKWDVDPSTPQRGTASPWTAMVHVFTNLVHGRTGTGFAWAFAGRNFSWIAFAIVVAVDAIAGLLAGVMWSVKADFDPTLAPLFDTFAGFTPVTGMLYLGLGRVAALLLIALAVFATLRAQHVNVTYMDALTIWMGVMALIIPLEAVLVVAASILATLAALVSPSLAVILGVLAAFAEAAIIIWGYVVGYQGQRWYSGTSRPFAGAWVGMLVAAWVLNGVVNMALMSMLSIE